MEVDQVVVDRRRDSAGLRVCSRCAVMCRGPDRNAAPYFRIFNPYEQTKRFDPDFLYIRKWVPEFEDFTYPPPIVIKLLVNVPAPETDVVESKVSS